MYTIIILLSGKFQCEGMLQDGTERWEEDSFAEAVKSLKSFAKVMNHSKIKKRDIKILKEVSAIGTLIIPYDFD